MAAGQAGLPSESVTRPVFRFPAFFPSLHHVSFNRHVTHDSARTGETSRLPGHHTHYTHYYGRIHSISFPNTSCFSHHLHRIVQSFLYLHLLRFSDNFSIWLREEDHILKLTFVMFSPNIHYLQIQWELSVSTMILPIIWSIPKDFLISLLSEDNSTLCRLFLSFIVIKFGQSERAKT